MKPPGGWSDTTETAKLTASDAAAFDQFGFSVSISGDTVVVGAIFAGHSGIDFAGSAYVFVKPPGGWSDTTEGAKLNASDAAEGDRFGDSVSISGDTVVVGAIGADHSGLDFAGAAYVFTRSGGVWTQQAKLTAADAAAGDEFGDSVSNNGETVVVGVKRDDHPGGTDAGSTYVFVKPPGGWSDTTETVKLTASDAAAGDQFGHSVSISGDTVVVGARLDDHSGFDFAGAAYVLSVGRDCNANGKLDECETFGPGDYTGDGQFNLDDMAFYEQCMPGPDQAPTPDDPGCSALCLQAFDLDGDGDVDLADFSQMMLLME